MLKLSIDKVGFNGLQFQFKSIKSDCLNNHLIPPTHHIIFTLLFLSSLLPPPSPHLYEYFLLSTDANSIFSLAPVD